MAISEFLSGPTNSNFWGWNPGATILTNSLRNSFPEGFKDRLRNTRSREAIKLASPGRSKQTEQLRGRLKGQEWGRVLSRLGPGLYVLGRQGHRTLEAGL